MQKKERILLFLKLPPPVTGATLMNQYVTESVLLKKKFNLFIIPVSYKTELKKNRHFPFRKILTIFKLHTILIKQLLQFKPEFIYFQPSPTGIAFFRDCSYIFIMKLLHCPIVYHLHGKGINEVISKSKIKKWFYNRAFKNTEVICLSKSLVYDIKEVFKGKPYIVNNGIPIQHSIHVLPTSTSAIQILFFSNLLISKGILDYLEAIRLLQEKSMPATFSCSIAGGEADLNEEDIYEEINKRNLKGLVSYLGPKYGKEKDILFSSSDILVFPTHNDVWGLVILEAMQAGIPVIASREGAIPEIVQDGISGFIVNKNKPEQITEKLELLIDDPDLRKRMGDAGRKLFFKKYTLDIFDKNMSRVFDEISQKLKLQQ